MMFTGTGRPYLFACFDVRSKTMLHHAPTKLEMDLCCISREAEIRQMLLAKEVLKNKKMSSFLRSTMLKTGRLLISMGNKIETRFLTESPQRSLDIVTH
jgi:hypothetical protein